MGNIKIPPIRNVIALLTNQCNCACEYCFERRNPKRMDYDVAQDILDFVHKSKSDMPSMTFFGGEPTLEWDTIIVPIVEYAESHYSIPTRFAMTTNGTLLNKERIDFLSKHHINFMLSLDGGRETQERNRPLRDGRSSFSVVMENLPYILEKNPGQNIRMTISADSCGNFFEDVKFFIDLGVKWIGALPNYFEIWTEEQKETLSRQIDLYEQYIIDSYRCGMHPLLMPDYRSSIYRIAILSKYKDIGRRTISNCDVMHQCGMGVRGSASVDVNGDLYGCHHISPLNRDSIWYIGNIYDGLDEDRVKDLISSYDPQKVGGNQCKECPLDNICNGGCTSNNYQINGDFHRVPDMYCYWSRLLSDSAYRVSCILGNEKNELFKEDFKNAIVRGG